MRTTLVVCACCVVVGFFSYTAHGSEVDVRLVEPSVENMLLSADWASVKMAIQSIPRTERTYSQWELLLLACHATRDYAGVMDVQQAKEVGERPDAEEFHLWASSLAERHPDNPIAQLIKGHSLARKGRYDGALDALTQVVKLDGRMSLAHRIRGDLLASGRRNAEAMLDFQVAVMLDPEDAMNYLARAGGHERQGDFDQAMKDYQKAIKLAPECPRFYAARGLAYASQEHYKEALRDADHALKLAPQWAEAWETRGTIHGMRERFEQAISDLDRAVQLGPARARTYVTRGLAYGEMGDLDQARADCEQALKLTPEGPDADTARALLVNLARVWPPLPSIGLLSPEGCEEKHRVPKEGVVRLGHRPWVILDSIEVTDAATGGKLSRSLTPKPRPGEYRVLSPGMIRFAAEDSGRSRRVSYGYQPPRVAVLPTQCDSEYEDVSSTVTSAIERQLKRLGCELVDRKTVDAAVGEAGQSAFVNWLRDRQAFAQLSKRLNAALLVVSSASVRSETTWEGTYNYRRTLELMTGRDPASTTWVSLVGVEVVNASGERMSSRVMWGAAPLVTPLFRGKSRRESVEAAANAAVENLLEGLSAP